MPIPPLPEQHRIVAAIEQQFSRLDESVATLQRDRQGLKRARASVLKYAVEGKLTEQWRAEHSTTEPASKLLQRILDERRAKWEAEQLAKMQARDVTPKDDTWKRAYKEPAAPDTSRLPELPERWCWATVDQLGDSSEQIVLTGPFGSNLGKDDFVSEGVSVLTIGCLTNGGIINLEKALYISEEKAVELARYRIRNGDLLFSRMASVGRAGLVTRQYEGAVINYHLMRLRLNNNFVNPHFFIAYAHGSKTVTDYIKVVNHGVTRDGINTEQLLSLPVAVPPLAEQEQIVTEVEERLSVIEASERAIEASLKRIERLRQDILQDAFAGRLVPQDPADEPASVLLQRIREERARREQEEQQRRKERTMNGSRIVKKTYG